MIPTEPGTCTWKGRGIKIQWWDSMLSRPLPQIGSLLLAIPSLPKPDYFTRNTTAGMKSVIDQV